MNTSDLNELKEALNGFVDNAGGYDKSIARAAAIALRSINPELSSRLIALDDKGRGLLRRLGFYDERDG